MSYQERKLYDRSGFEQSIRNFEGWLGGVVSGGTDLDFICERNRRFLVVEGKRWKNGVRVPVGQHLMLERMLELPAWTVCLVGEDKEDLWLLWYDQAPAPLRRGKFVWFAPEWFVPSDAAGLRARVKRWWEFASQEAA